MCPRAHPFFLSRRKEATRTPDPYVPNVVRYQLRYFPKATGYPSTKTDKVSSIAGAKVQHSRQTTKENGLFFAKSKVFYAKCCKIQIKDIPLHPQNERNTAFCPAEDLSASDGVIAQLVEQRTENPCVPGSIPGDTTQEKQPLIDERQSGVFR